MGYDQTNRDNKFIYIDVCFPILQELAIIMRIGPPRKLFEAIVNRWSLKLPRKIQLNHLKNQLSSMLHENKNIKYRKQFY